MAAPFRSTDGVYQIWRNGDKGFMSKRGASKVAEYRAGMGVLEGGVEGLGEDARGGGGKGVGARILDALLPGNDSSDGEDQDEPGVLESLLAWAMPSPEAEEDEPAEERTGGSAARGKGGSIAERGDGSVTFRVSKGRGEPGEVDGIDVQIGDVIWACSGQEGARGALPILVEDVFLGQEGLFNAQTRPVFGRGDAGAQRGGARRSRAKFTAYVVGRVTGGPREE